MKTNERIILHCDANSFYASVEIASKPELKNKPVAVSGNPKKRTGIILAKNEVAKKFKVKTGEPIYMAKEKCPDLICLAPHHDLYEDYSKKLRQIYSKYTDLIEPFGIDECWLDITGSMLIFKSAEAVANEIRQRVKNELGITVSVGISFCKLFAKLGSDFKKPDAVTVISKQNFKNFVYPMPVNSVIGIGRKMAPKLKKLNITTLGEYVNMPDKIIKEKFGKPAIELKKKLEGFDNDPVEKPNNIPKSVGNGTTTIVDIKTKEEIKATISFLSEKIARRLRKKGLLATGVGIWVKNSQFKTFSKEHKIDFPTNSAKIIAQNAFELVCTFWNFDQDIRAVRVNAFRLVSEGDFAQTSLFYDNKKQGLGFGIDALKQKYGPNSITLASSIKTDFLNDYSTTDS